MYTNCEYTQFSRLQYSRKRSVMEDMLEPPNVEHIMGSFRELPKIGMLTAPSDDGEITMIGRIGA